MFDAPSKDLLSLIALLAWVTYAEAKEYLDNFVQRRNTTLENDLHLRIIQSIQQQKSELENMCKHEKIPVTSALTKLDLTRLLVDKQGTQLPPLPVLYDGKLSHLPNSVTSINKTLSVSKLRAILMHHKFPMVGSKDELVLRVFYSGMVRP